MLLKGTVLLLLGACLMVKVGGLPVLDVGGFTWAENLAFDKDPNVLFVTDSPLGLLWKLELSSSGQKYERRLHVEKGNFLQMGGLAFSQDFSTLFANYRRDNKTSGIAKVDPLKANTYTIMPTPFYGNGLALSWDTGGEEYLWYTSEGDFVPTKGKIGVLNVRTGDAAVVSTTLPLSSTDGCRVDNKRQLLYVSNVLTARVDAFSIAYHNDSGALPTLHHSKVLHPPLKSLDDFALANDGSWIWGADFFGGSVIGFSTDPKNNSSRVLMTDLKSPTSVQLPIGSDFNSSCAFVTEGGGIPGVNHNRAVLQTPPLL